MGKEKTAVRKRTWIDLFTGGTSLPFLAVWAAILTVTSMVPLVPVFGAGLTYYPLGDVLVGITGLLFGPFGGLIIGLIASTIAHLTIPLMVGLHAIPRLTMGSFAAGLAVQGTKKSAIVVTILSLPVFILWALSPIGQIWQGWPMILTRSPGLWLSIMMIFTNFPSRWIKSDDMSKVAVATSIFAIQSFSIGYTYDWFTFFAIMSPFEAILGNPTGLAPILWPLFFIVSGAQELIMCVVGSIACSAVVIAIKRSRLRSRFVYLVE